VASPEVPRVSLEGLGGSCVELIHAMWRGTPWAAAGLATSAVLALIAARPLGRRLRTSAVLTFLWILLLGVVLTLTVTPGLSRLTVHVCSLQPARPVPVGDLLAPGGASFNVWMFVPLALLSVLPRPGRTLLLALGTALTLPFLVEAVQWALPAMGRDCTSKDIVDNLTGVVIGAGLGALLRLGLSWRRHRPDPATLVDA
jgi:hypothetical protein